MPVRKKKERTHSKGPAVVIRAQSPILKDPEQSMGTLASRKSYVFKQDGALAHTNHLVQNCLSENLNIF